MSTQRCKHGKAMENPCWECDEEKPAETDLEYFQRRQREVARPVCSSCDGDCRDERGQACIQCGGEGCI